MSDVDRENWMHRIRMLAPVIQKAEYEIHLNEAEVKRMSARVDINNLLARVRDEKKKENKINLVFFGLFASLIIVVGIILSF